MPITTRSEAGGGQVDCLAAGVGVLRNYRGAAFMRMPSAWRYRPSQADQMHVSLYWDGAWLTEDVGTLSYRGGSAEDF